MIRYMILGVFSFALSACEAAPSSAERHARDLVSFCEQITEMMAANYATLPAHYTTKYDALVQQGKHAEGQVRLLDLQHIPSTYEIIYQHRGPEAVTSYCLERHSASGL